MVTLMPMRAGLPFESVRAVEGEVGARNVCLSGVGAGLRLLRGADDRTNLPAGSHDRVTRLSHTQACQRCPLPPTVYRALPHPTGDPTLEFRIVRRQPRHRERSGPRLPCEIPNSWEISW